MKQLLFLLLFPCLALAQYTGNGNQKITLGEQTTADGLVYRGIRADTASKIVPFSDTSAYIILDTVEKTLWLYKAGQVPKWQQVGGSTLDTATMLLPYYRAGRNTIIQAADVPTLNQNTTGSAATLTTGRTIQTNLASTSAATFNGSANITPGVTGTLPVANGGTGAGAFTSGSVVFAGASGTYTQDNSSLFYDNTNDRLGIGTASPVAKLTINKLPVAESGSTSYGSAVFHGINYNLSYTQRGIVDINNIDVAAQNNGSTLTFTNNAGMFGQGYSYVGVGLKAGKSNASNQNQSTYFAISTNNSGSLTEKMRLDESGNVGIGTASPSDKLTVSTAASGGNTGAKFVSTDNTASTNVIVDVENSAGKRLQIVGFGGSASGNFLGTTRAGNSFVVKAGGKLGIGVDDDYDLFLAAGYTSGVKTMTIEQNGGFKFSTLAGSGSRAVNADANGVITATSSILIKENVESINYGLKDVLKLNPVIFNYIDKYKWGEGKELGFIAEDVMNIIPESTGVMANSDIYFDLQKLIPVLTKAIQEQQILIKALEQRILTLENK